MRPYQGEKKSPRPAPHEDRFMPQVSHIERPQVAKNEPSRRSVSRHRSVKKSIGLLQAYGEFDRFMEQSMQVMKDLKKEQR